MWPDPPVLVAIIASATAALGAWLTWLASGTAQLRGRISDLEAKWATTWAARERDALIKRAQGDHIDLLEHHIWRGNHPPPPPRPTDV